MEKRKLNLLYSLVILISFSALIHGKSTEISENTDTQIQSTEDKDKNDLLAESSLLSSDIKTSYPNEYLSKASLITISSGDFQQESSISTSRSIIGTSEEVTPFISEKIESTIFYKDTDDTIIKSTINDITDIKTEIKESTENKIETTFPSHDEIIISIPSSINPSPSISNNEKTDFSDDILSTEPSYATENKIETTFPSHDEIITSIPSSINPSPSISNNEKTDFSDVSTEPVTNINKSTEPSYFPSNQETTNNLIPEKESTVFNTGEKSFDTKSISTGELIPTSTNEISIPTTNVPSSIPPIPTTVTNTGVIVDDDTSLVLIGFSHLKKYDFNISFIIHFSQMKGKIYSKNLNFPVQISYKRFLRLLERQEANCTYIGQLNQKISYFCEVQTETQNIDNIKIIPDFNFILQKPLVSISPLSTIYMDNIEKVGEESDNLLNSNLYILSHSQIQDEKNKSFTVSGTINGAKPKFQKNNIHLIANIESQNSTSETELICDIIDIIGDKYTLRCKGEKNKTYIIQNSISIIEDEILLINFDKDEVSKITIIIYESPREGLSTGGVIAIIIITIFFGYFI